MILETVEQETGASPHWSVLWLHGLGADGHDFAPIVPELVRPDWPALRFVFPHAPVQPVTINNGVPMRSWYDIRSMDFSNRADAEGVAEAIAWVETLIAREGERGVPPERLLLAGFSQGGAVALATGLRRQVPLAGLIGLSTYLPGANDAAAVTTAAALGQKVFMAHGSGDPVVPLQFAERSRDTLHALGFDIQWHRYPMAHQVCAEEIRDLGDWMGARFGRV